MSCIKRMTVALLSFSAIAATIPAHAQIPAGAEAKLAARFNAADTNHDGKLTREEAQAGMPRVAKNFDRIDSAHIGTITLAQLEAFLQQMSAN